MKLYCRPAMQVMYKFVLVLINLHDNTILGTYFFFSFLKKR
jgi:hypothetical protein